MYMPNLRTADVMMANMEARVTTTAYFHVGKKSKGVAATCEQIETRKHCPIHCSRECVLDGKRVGL